MPASKGPTKHRAAKGAHSPKSVKATASGARHTRKARPPSSGKRAASRGPATKSYGVRKSSKLGAVITMLHRKGGATIETICKATGWQSHSVRGVLSGTIRKKLGLDVQSMKTDGVRTYRIID